MISEKIKALCDSQNTNFAQLEKAVGLGNGTLRKWDKSVPGIDKLKSVADFFGVSIDSLVGREGYDLSLEARKCAVQFEELPDDKKELLRCYLSVLKAG